MENTLLFLKLVGFYLSSTFAVAQNATVGYVIFTQSLTPKGGKNADLPFKSTLTFNKNRSFYIEKQNEIEEREELNSDLNSANIYKKSSTDRKFYVFIDKQKKIIRSSEFILARSFIIEDKLINLDWKILSERKKIGNFSCQKAQIRTRNRSYTAWFTPQIPVNAGPWKLWGLPGLILQADSDDGEVHFAFESLSLSPSTKAIEVPKAVSKSFTPEEFVKMRREMLINIQKNLESQTVRRGNVVIELNTFSIDKYPN